MKMLSIYSLVSTFRGVLASRFLRKRRSQTRAFTLVETVASMGIISFAMLGILGLVSVGLSNLRDAINLGVQSQIVESIANDVTRTDVKNLASTKRHYDEQGNQVAADDPSLIYTADIQLRTVTDGSLDLPVIANILVIQVSNMTNPGKSKRYPLVVSKD